MKYKPYKFNGKTMIIEKYVVLSSCECTPQEYDIFSLEPDKNAMQIIEKINNSDDLQLFNDMDRGKFNTFRYIEGCQNKKYSLYAGVYSKTNTKIIVNVNASKAKLWINGKCISIHSKESLTNYYQIAELKRGINHIVFEQLCYKPDNRFFVQIRDYEREMGNEIDSLSNVSNVVELDPFILVHDPLYCLNESEFRFMYFKNDVSGYKEKYEIELSDSVKGVVETITGIINKPQKIDLVKLRNLCSDTLRHEQFICKMSAKDNKIIQTHFEIYPNDFLPRAEEVKGELMLKAKGQPSNICAQALGEIQKFNNSLREERYIVCYWDLVSCNEILTSIKNMDVEKYAYKCPGAHQVYIHSNLDDSFVKVGIRVPPQYSEMKKYPAFIAIASAGQGTFSQDFFAESELNEKCLCFDITGRGYTAGSYIGQASILEILDWIKKEFSVDEDRLYFIGYSNGGFGVYSIAQNFPHIPAAIYPLVGHPQIETIENISNIPTYQMISTKDYLFEGRRNEVKNKIGKYGNYHQYDVKELNHIDMSVYLQHRKILNDMLKHTRIRYPKNIRFKTCRNRGLKSYWIEIHGIARGKKWAKISADICDFKTIRIKASGVTGLTVTLPPEIDRAQFNIVINNKELEFKNYPQDNIIFEKANSWKVSDRKKETDLCKGSGLLDVYLEKLRIVVPQNCEEQITQLAQRFCEPNTNGFFPLVFAKFPVYSEDNLCDNIFDNNLIVLDVNNECEFISELRDMLPIQYDKSGFSYKDVSIKEDYVIMQIIPSPYNKERTIMVVSTNNAELLKKHILLRKIIIPTYVNGLHKYWNNEALVYDGKGYYAVYEKDATLIKI